MLFLKTFKDAKFVVDGNAFQTIITLSTKNFCLMSNMSQQVNTQTHRLTDRQTKEHRYQWIVSYLFTMPELNTQYRN